MEEDKIYSYIVCYDNQCDEVEAKTSFQAYCIGIDRFKPPKDRRYLVSVHLNKETVADF